MISQDFVNWIAGIRPRPVVKQRRTAKPGTIGAMTAKQFDDLVGGVFSKAIGMTGPVTIADALAQQQAQEQAEKIQGAYSTFSQVIQNIMASPEVPDKGAAVKTQAEEFRQLLDSVISAAKSKVRHGTATKGLLRLQFKTVGIPPVEHAEALKMLLNMTPAERQKLMDQLAAIEQAALDWNMTAGDVIDLIKG